MSQESTFHSDLVACMNAIPSVHKDLQNSHFKQKYASLDAVMSKIKPVLQQHHFCLLTDVWTLDRELAIKMKLLHKSGESHESSVYRMAIANPTPQGQGSTTTYLRRQAICSFLNITTDEDDDGNVASNNFSKAIASAEALKNKKTQGEDDDFL
jgi:hypothetical protein